MTTAPVVSVTDELLAEIEDGCLDSVDCPLSILSDLAAELRTLRAENAELKQELAACRVDAVRYQWLRSADDWPDLGMYTNSCDAAIDAAMQEQAE